MDIPRLFRIRSAGRFYVGVNHARVRLRALASVRVAAVDAAPVSSLGILRFWTTIPLECYPIIEKLIALDYFTLRTNLPMAIAICI